MFSLISEFMTDPVFFSLPFFSFFLPIFFLSPHFLIFLGLSNTKYNQPTTTNKKQENKKMGGLLKKKFEKAKQQQQKISASLPSSLPSPSLNSSLPQLSTRSGTPFFFFFFSFSFSLSHFPSFPSFFSSSLVWESFEEEKLAFSFHSLSLSLFSAIPLHEWSSLPTLPFSPSSSSSPLPLSPSSPPPPPLVPSFSFSFVQSFPSTPFSLSSFIPTLKPLSSLCTFTFPPPSFASSASSPSSPFPSTPSPFPRVLLSYLSLFDPSCPSPSPPSSLPPPPPPGFFDTCSAKSCLAIRFLSLSLFVCVSLLTFPPQLLSPIFNGNNSINSFISCVEGGGGREKEGSEGGSGGGGDIV